jgi:hypothetical protein
VLGAAYGDAAGDSDGAAIGDEVLGKAYGSKVGGGGESRGGDIEGAAGVGNSTRCARADAGRHTAANRTAIAGHGLPTAQSLNTGRRTEDELNECRMAVANAQSALRRRAKRVGRYWLQR